MKVYKFSVLFLTALSFYPFGTLGATGVSPTFKSNSQFIESAVGLHIPFVENRGQVANSSVAYVIDTFTCQVAVTRDGQLIYSLHQKNADVEMNITERLVGAVDIDVQGRVPRKTKVSYFEGREHSGWLRNLQSYGRVELGSIAQDIRVELKAHSQNVEKLFYLQPGADPSNIRLAVQDAKELQVAKNGELEVTAAKGFMRFSAPIAYQHIDGHRQNVPVRYSVRKNTYGFELGSYDTSRELVIDPLVNVFAIKYGDDKKHNAIMDMTTDAQGNIYAVGYAKDHCAIWKLDRKLENMLATAFFSRGATYSGDNIRSVGLDSNGNVFVAGHTYNPEFPVTPGCLDSRYSKPGTLVAREGFIAKFSADLSTLLASTYIGGDSNDALFDMAIDSRDRIYVAGYSYIGRTTEYFFPVTPGAYDTNKPPIYQNKGVVARLDNNLSSVQTATYIGGSVDDDLDRYEDVVHRMALDSKGDLWIAGRTTQPDFPVTPDCLDNSYNGKGDVFLSKLDSELQTLLISTHIGGNEDEAPTDVLLDSQGNLYLLGWTFSSNFPIPETGYDTSYGNMEEDGFIIKLNETATRILAGTFLGGTYDPLIKNRGDDVPAAMALAADDSQLLVVGRTESENFPITEGCLDAVIDDIDISSPGRNDAPDLNYGDGFISALSGDLSTLLYSTFVGGNGCEYLDAVLVNGNDIIIGGETQTGEFPMAPAENNTPRAVLMRFATENEEPEEGDVNNDGGITLDDAILSLKLLAGVVIETPIFKESDINNNNKVDMSEAIWVLRKIAGL